MECIVSNYDEFLNQLKENANVYINDDVKHWDSWISKRIGEIGVSAEIGTSFELQTLDAFETKNRLPYCTKFIVTGVNSTDDEENVNYVTKVLAM